MMGHLGTRVSALLDGRLGAEEEDRAWEHVHDCHVCRDLVEREGWVKTRLAGLGHGDPTTPAGLKGSLLDRSGWSVPPGDAYLQLSNASRPRRAVGFAAIGGSAVGAAMVGVLALGTAPADAPTLTNQVPTTSINQPAQLPVFGPRLRDEQP